MVSFSVSSVIHELTSVRVVWSMSCLVRELAIHELSTNCLNCETHNGDTEVYRIEK